MAEPTIIDLKRATVKLLDGTGTPNQLALNIDSGNVTFTSKRNIDYRKNRGKLAGGAVREGDEEPCEVKLQCRFDKIISANGEAVSVKEFLTQTGAAAAYKSTGAACEPYAVNIVVELDYDCENVIDEIITFTQFRWENIGGDFKEGVLDISGRCNEIFPSSQRTTIA